MRQEFRYGRRTLPVIRLRWVCPWKHRTAGPESTVCNGPAFTAGCGCLRRGQHGSTPFMRDDGKHATIVG